MVKNDRLSSASSEIRKSSFTRYFFSVAIIILAASLRLWPLGALELRIPWVTFYPAVMAAALYGGFFTGLLATFMALLVVYFWSPTNMPFIDDSGDWLGVAVFFVNGSLISMMSGAMHRAKAQATKAREQAESANKAKSVFLANMSHELRTPLNAILGFTAILRKGPEASEDQVTKLDIISNSGENLLNLINNVLDISKIEAGHMAREDSDTNLGQLLREIESLMTFRMQEKELNFSLNLADDLPENIIVDQGKLRQVLTNLIANAVKYTEKGQVSLDVRVAQQETPEKLWLRFEIKDTGIGIQQNNLEKIFHPFEQVGNQPARESGTGLGLAICKQFVALMDGTLGVNSKFGEGTTFSFEFPVMISERSGNIPENVNKTAVGLVQGQKKFKLLIAEDKLENRLLLQGILEPWGFEIREAVNGQEATEVHRDWQPDLIWMDIRMPVMSGLEATRQIKKTNTGASTKIVALTAHALEEERIEILNSGCDDFIRKPYRASEIQDALMTHLGVRFLYENEEIQEKTPEQCSLEHGDFLNVSPELLDELQTAAELLDAECCQTVIRRIGMEDIELGNRLSCMVRKLKYRELLDALDSLASKGIK